MKLRYLSILITIIIVTASTNIISTELFYNRDYSVQKLTFTALQKTQGHNLHITKITLFTTVLRLTSYHCLTATKPAATI